MKTAEALAKTLYLDITDDNGNIRMSAQNQIETFLERQLLNAYKAGMAEAAEICKHQILGLDCEDCASCTAHKNDYNSIISARDKKTTL